MEHEGFIEQVHIDEALRDFPYADLIHVDLGVTAPSRVDIAEAA